MQDQGADKVESLRKALFFSIYKKYIFFEYIKRANKVESLRNPLFFWIYKKYLILVFYAFSFIYLNNISENLLRYKQLKILKCYYSVQGVCMTIEFH